VRGQLGAVAAEQQVLDGGEDQVGRRLPGRGRLEDVDRQRVIGQGDGQALVERRLTRDVDGEATEALGDALAIAQQSKAPALWISGSPAGASKPSVGPSTKPVPAGSHS